MSSARFLPRLWPITSGAWRPMMLTYVVLAFFVEVPWLSDWPFGVAMLVGAAAALRQAVPLYRDEALVVHAWGLTDPFTGVSLRWDALEAIELSVVELRLSDDQTRALRVARLRGEGGEITFADLGPGLVNRVGPIANLPGAGLVLAVAAARSGADLGPPSWSGQVVPKAASPVVVRASGGQDMAGLVALGVKLVPKAGSIALKLLKTIKPGAALATVGVYSLLFSWKAAVALVVMVGVHECGHVYAMWRSGVEVKGIYFIPFFGGAAVSKGVAGSHAQSAYIAINGPIWGGLLALACLVGFWVTGSPELGAMAAWGALINLFNLLPIYPLDGGRLVASLAHAGLGPFGVLLVLASLGSGAVLGYVSGLELLTLMAILGLGEWGGHVAAAPYRPAIDLLDGRPYGVDEEQWFHDQVRVVERGASTPERVEARREGHANRLAHGAQVPMTGGQGMIVLAGYGVVVVALLAMLWLTSGIEGAGDPLELLQ
jgi:Zn-dependent protease